jgi:hypothetical protein
VLDISNGSAKQLDLEPVGVEVAASVAAPPIRPVNTLPHQVALRVPPDDHACLAPMDRIEFAIERRGLAVGAQECVEAVINGERMG